MFGNPGENVLPIASLTVYDGRLTWATCYRRSGWYRPLPTPQSLVERPVLALATSPRESSFGVRHLAAGGDLLMIR